jgi:hypothetical protein
MSREQVTLVAHTWRYYTIDGEEFYAPSIDFAFGLARARHPFKAEWSCTGSRR